MSLSNTFLNRRPAVIQDRLINALDRRGYRTTALIMAARRGHTATVEGLLAAGADVNAKDEDGNTALIATARRGHSAIAEVLLAAGADVNAKDEDGNTALIAVVGARRGNTATIEVLLAAGADVNAKNKHGETALKTAALFGNRAAVRAIAEHAMNSWIPRHRDRQRDRIGFREFVRSTRVRGTYDGEEYEIDRLPIDVQRFIKGFL